MIFVDRDRCTGCGNCVVACSENAIALSGAAVRIDEARCIGCLACLEACPVCAIIEVLETTPGHAQAKPVAEVLETTPWLARAKPAAGVLLALAPSQAPSVIKRLGVALAPLAMDMFGMLVDRWLSRRSSALGRYEPKNSGRCGPGRRNRRHGRR